MSTQDPTEQGLTPKQREALELIRHDGTFDATFVAPLDIYGDPIDDPADEDFLLDDISNLDLGEISSPYMLEEFERRGLIEFGPIVGKRLDDYGRGSFDRVVEITDAGLKALEAVR